MNDKEFAVMVTAIKGYFPNFILNNAQMDLWNDSLNDLNYQEAQKAIKKIAQTSEYPPTIALIRKEYNKVIGIEEVSPVEVIADINKVMSKFGRYRQEEGWEWLKTKNPTAYKVLDAMGYTNYCNSTPSVVSHLIEKMVKSIQSEQNNQLLLERKFASEIRLLAQPKEDIY